MPSPSAETSNMVGRAAAILTWSDEMNVSRVSGVGIREDGDDVKRRRLRLEFDVVGVRGQNRISDSMPVDASITRLQTALFCGKLVSNDQEVSDDVGIDVRNSLGCFSDDSEYRCQGRPLILNLC
jgi:hypothetical protein